MAIKKKESVITFPRPIDNRVLIGHADVKRSFLDAWGKNYPVHPVWLITGPKGIGKATLVYNLIGQIFLEQGFRINDLEPGYDATNDYEAIRRRMSVGGIGDLYIVDIEHSDTKTKTIPISALSAMIQKMHMSSMAESWRVVVIDSIDELSRDAPNAILKILEEPPAKTIFFLIAHSLDRVLPTIRSRSRIEKLRPLSGTELREIAAILLPEREIGHGLIKISGGSFGKIAEMAASGADNLFEDLVLVMKNTRSGSADILALSKRITKNCDTISVLMDVIHYFGTDLCQGNKKESLPPPFADLYSRALCDIERMHTVNLEPEITVFKILTEIKRCV